MILNCLNPRCIFAAGLACAIPGLALLHIQVAQAEADRDANDGGAILEAPRDNAGRIIFFPGDAKPLAVDEKQIVNVDEVFSAEKTKKALQYVKNLWRAHERLQNGLFHGSNLRDFAPNGENPYNFQGEKARDLPDDAVIIWRISKPDFVALDLPAWDTLVLGGTNWNRFLEASFAYQQFTSARLGLALLDALNVKDGGDRTALEQRLQQNKAAVVQYLQEEPAD